MINNARYKNSYANKKKYCVRTKEKIIDGELTYISSDTLTEEGPDGRPETYYRAHITIAEDYRERNTKFKGINLKPGMTADINIMTSRRTIITYLSKPIIRAFGGALTEK